ncbi:FAD-binding domain-containing protein [Lentzea sp. HUAS12]|uniref:FAD-binding domain-containing protein n=1 Tax=Lentzea sp. HUAS12 TaxID=2951806 RepID=UPI00209DADCD|nr:FAD-binding domain-containing protein [Lentzea sp. HUAS12]USX53973.1 deoxyribodipyrimidine photolyase [Lentzea sp. HUAS12]
MLLPTPAPGPEAAELWVRTHLGDLCCDTPEASPAFRGGQQAADAALGTLELAGYAARRNEVLPRGRRGASRLSPYIRHGLIALPEAWAAAAAAPPRDRAKFRDELAWQEYGRHLYARLGTRGAAALRAAPARATVRWTDPWPERMRCVSFCVEELETDGWLVNQTRMWLASQWTVRAGADWTAGENRFFAHLLDGSRAANRVGWQWTIGAGTGKPYGFSRWQVRKRAPQLCRECPLSVDCPIEDWPASPAPAEQPEPEPLLRHDPDPESTGGPRSPAGHGRPEAVWLTAESLGDADPALAAHPDLPAVFVFDTPLLARLRLSGKRLVFLTETLADLATRREVAIHRDDVVQQLRERDVAVTFAPVPGFRSRAAAVEPSTVHPWRWLFRPHGGPVSSYTAWRKKTAGHPG